MRRFIALALFAVLAIAATAFAASDGTYKGKIKEGKTDVSVTVKGGKVTKFKAVVYGYCNGTGMLMTVAYPPAHEKGKTIKVKGDGSFAVAFSGDPTVEDDLRTVKGIFKGAKKVTGTVQVQGLCQADGSYTAKR